jgi:hypothetical protein
MKKIVLSISITLLLLGCAPFRAYHGPRRPNKEVAHLIVNDLADQILGLAPDNETVYLRKVNGYIVQKDKVAVLPGPCEVQLGYREDEDYHWVSSHGTIPLTFEAEAGAVYYFRASTVDRDHWQATVYQGGKGKVAESPLGLVLLHEKKK